MISPALAATSTKSREEVRGGKKLLNVYPRPEQEIWNELNEKKDMPTNLLSKSKQRSRNSMPNTPPANRKKIARTPTSSRIVSVANSQDT
jgi:hypothetical protein